MAADGYVRVHGRIIESQDAVGQIRADQDETAIAHTVNPLAGCTVAVEVRVPDVSREVVGGAIGPSNAQGYFDLFITRHLGPHDVALTATCEGRPVVAGVFQQQTPVTWIAVRYP